MSEFENVKSTEESLEQSHEGESNNANMITNNESIGGQILQQENASANSNLSFAQVDPTYQQSYNNDKNPNFFIKIILPLVLFALLILISIFAGYETYSAFTLNKIAATNKAEYQKELNLVNSIQTQNANLNTDIAKLNVKYTNLETELSKTAAGKAALQSANSTLQTQNVQLDQKATNAEQQMNKAQEDLKAKLTELATVNTDLIAKKTELDKANRGVSKFADLQNLYITFKQNKDDLTGYYNDSIGQINNYMATENASYRTAANNDLAQAHDSFLKMEDINTQMDVIFDLIKSGNY
jgi:hypothetical protein